MAAPDQQRGKPTGEKYMQTALSQIKTRTNSVGNAAELGFSDRVMPSVSPPATNKPTDSEFYEPDPNSGGLRISHDFLKSHFFKEGRLTEAQALFILERAIEVLKREDNLVTVQSPITICGDIHGQYYDLMKLFEVGGNWIENRYLFLGDYVDRGSFGIECLLYLYTLKINFPTRFTLLRGNHECRHLTEYFTFKRECLHKYSEAVYEKCIESFCALPLGAIVDGRFFCVHGGISPELLKVEDMRRLNRFMEPGSHGLLCDLLWADPYPSFGHESESGAHPALAPGTTFVHNQTRGCSFFYTYEAACQFLERNGLLGIIRGHEAQNDGYTMYRKTPSKKFPSVITIFSAPNYLDVYRNRGAVLKYQNKNITIRQYNSSPHPYWLPNFMDAFTWSLPFVGAKIAEMLLAVLSVCSQEELVDSESDSEDEETKAGPDAAARRQQIKSKIIAVGRMQRVFQLLREEAENATELNVDGPMSDGTPANASGLAFGPNALTVQGIQINRSIHNFTEARHSDILNERLPEFAQTQQTIFPAPSMRVLHTTRRSTGDSVGSGRASPNSVDGGSGTPTGGTMPGGLNMEYLIKKTLEEDEEQGSMVERLADSIARVRKAGVLGKPEPLKRHGTA